MRFGMLFQEGLSKRTHLRILHQLGMNLLVHRMVLIREGHRHHREGGHEKVVLRIRIVDPW